MRLGLANYGIGQSRGRPGGLGGRVGGGGGGNATESRKEDLQNVGDFNIIVAA